MHDERNAETKQRLLDHQMETAVWPAEELEQERFGDFSHIGGREIRGPFVPEKSSKPTDFSHIGGRCIFPAPDAPEESTGDDNTD